MARFGFGFFIGPGLRNDPVELENPHPVARLGDDQYSGSPFHDGYTRLSRADPNRQGNPPPVKGTVGRVPRGPDTSFEQ